MAAASKRQSPDDEDSLFWGQAWVSVGRVWLRSTLTPAPFSPYIGSPPPDQREAAT
jgi:hypothetical protein